jgi:hypothetical protein
MLGKEGQTPFGAGIERAGFVIILFANRQTGAWTGTQLMQEGGRAYLCRMDRWQGDGWKSTAPLPGTGL